MHTKDVLWAAALALGAAGSALAAERSPNMFDTGQTQMDKQTGKLDVSDTDIKSLRERGYTWGDVGRALLIADQSGKKLSDVTSLRDSGLGWDDIGSRFNVSGFGTKQGKKSKKDKASITPGSTEPGMREAPSGTGPSGMESPQYQSSPSVPPTLPGTPDQGGSPSPGSAPPTP